MPLDLRRMDLLKGQAKTDYQREYMRRKRSNKSKPLDLIKLLDPVRPKDPIVQVTKLPISKTGCSLEKEQQLHLK